jgi:hypothetical protein
MHSFNGESRERYKFMEVIEERVKDKDTSFAELFHKSAISAMLNLHCIIIAYLYYTFCKHAKLNTKVRWL